MNKTVKICLLILVSVSFSISGKGVGAFPLVNGNFSNSLDLSGYTATGSGISEPTGNFAQIDTTGAPGDWLQTLEQTFDIPSETSLLSFDFAFSTDGTPSFSGFPDSFAVSIVTVTEFLDILVVDLNGVIPDPSEGVPTATAIDVIFDNSINISGFTPLGGATYSGNISLLLPNAVLGSEASLYFDLFDQADGFNTRVAIDNISVTSPVPEPHTLFLLGLGSLGGFWGARKKKYSEKFL